jgi:hypothetical protein
MKRCWSVLMLCVLSTGFALADIPNASLTPVKATHHRDKRVHRHRAHKAAKHHTPKRHRHEV